MIADDDSEGGEQNEAVPVVKSIRVSSVAPEKSVVAKKAVIVSSKSSYGKRS